MSSKNGSCVEDDCWGHELINVTNDIYTKQLVAVDLWYHTTVIVFLTTLGINGTLLNGLVLRYFWYRRQNLNSYNIVLINLAFVELLLATIGVSFDDIEYHKTVADGKADGSEQMVAPGKYLYPRLIILLSKGSFQYLLQIVIIIGKHFL